MKNKTMFMARKKVHINYFENNGDVGDLWLRKVMNERMQSYKGGSHGI